MSSVFAMENFTPFYSDGFPNIFDAAYTNMRFQVKAQTSITINAAWESNLPGLAAAYLGSRYLAWTLVMFNGLYDSVADVKPGTVIRIPDPTSLLQFLRTPASGVQGYLPNLNLTVL